jgi:hypothetical protein
MAADSGETPRAGASSDQPTTFTTITRRGEEQVRETWGGVKITGRSAQEIEQAASAGYEPNSESGYFVGRDPRAMSQDELRDIGHEAMSATAAIRAKCLDCCAGSAHEVRLCAAIACPSWPWRMGTNPWRAPPSEERREQGRRLAAKRAGKFSDPGATPGSSAGSPWAAPQVPPAAEDVQ